MNNLFNLSNKTAIITGSSRGIGRAIAEAFASYGARVVISSRNQDKCDEVADKINAKYDDKRAIAIAASISSKSALQAMVDKTREEFGGIDILVCNAASNPSYGPMLDISDEQFKKILNNNIISNHWLVSMTATDLMKSEGGSIIIVSSVGGFVGSDVIGAYSISKAADFQLVRNLAVELGFKGINVNAIAPGVTRTDFAKALYENPETEARLNELTPLGRIGEAEDVAGVAVFLASKAGGFITGQSIVVDGGALISGKY